MASAHFKPGELIAYLESTGARFGAHVNAQTGFDETIYMLDVPTDRPGVLQRGLDALGDFAGGITLDTQEIDKERGVVLEEWRGRLGAGTRMQEPQFRAFFGTSKYASRLPIGTPESIKSFPYQRLRDFYRDHYRPDRMAAIVVGDVQPAEVEAMLRSSFGNIPRRNGGRRADVPVPPHQETRYVSLSDPEQTASSVSIMVKRPFDALESAAAYRRSLLRSLALSMINDRLAEIARQPDAPFLAASVGVDHLGRALEAATIGARVQDGRIPQGLAGISQEIQRIRRFGFGAAELERGKRAMLAGFERAYNERDRADSQTLIDELVRHYLNKEAAPGIERELELVKEILPQVTTQQVADLARDSVRRRQSGRAGSVATEGGTCCDHRCLAARSDDHRDECVGHAVARRNGRARTDAEEAAAGNGAQPPRDSRNRRHRAHALERRRCVAEADRLPQRPDHFPRLCARRDRRSRRPTTTSTRRSRHRWSASAASAASHPWS